MKSFTLPLLTGLMVALPALMPVAAHAQISTSLTGSTGVSIGASTTASIVTPIVVTQASAQADLNASAQSSGTMLATTSLGAETSGDAGLSAHADMLTANDAKVSSIHLSSTQVALSYREPAKLFGFISVSVPVQVTVDASGATSVQYPWYNFLLSSQEADLAAKVHAAVDQQLSGSVGANATFSADTESRVLDSVYGVASAEAQANTSATVNAQ